MVSTTLARTDADVSQLTPAGVWESRARHAEDDLIADGNVPSARCPYHQWIFSLGARTGELSHLEGRSRGFADRYARRMTG